MPPIVTFIGWHDSGKTTLATQVVSHLKKSGYRVAVIKSSKETGIAFDRPGTDSNKHRQAGADSVLFVAPDQMVLMTDNSNLSLTTLAHRYFPDVDIVIGEGFKKARHVAKIEVVRDKAESSGAQASASMKLMPSGYKEQLLRDEVQSVIAVATDKDINGDNIFRLNESAEIASFIEKRFLQEAKTELDKTVLLVNGNKVPLKEFARKSLGLTVTDFVKSLKFSDDVKEIELRIKLAGEP